MDRSTRIFFLILALLIGVVYAGAINNEPTNWDDPALFNRAAIRGFSAENIEQVMTLHKNSTWQPLRDISYMIDFQLGGDDQVQVVRIMHIHNILLYIIMVFCLWLFLRELLRAFEVPDEQAWLWAVITTLIFAVHPVHVESVTWLYARKEPLVGIFTLLTVWGFLRGREGHWAYYILSAVCLVLATLAKPVALAIPGVLIVLDFALQRQAPDEKFWRHRLPIFLPIMIFALVMIWRLVAMMFSAGGVKPWHGGDPWNNLLAASRIFIGYIELIAFRGRYAADYIIELYADYRLWQAWAFVGLNLLIIGSGIWAFFRKHLIYAVFVAWFYLLLVPVSHILPINQILTDRYALLPSLSWCVLLGYLLMRIIKFKNERISEGFPRLIGYLLAGFTIGIYSLLSMGQNMVWQNSQSLWENTIEVTPNSSSANVNLSVIYIHQQRYEEAIELCLRAVERLPYDYLAIGNLALAQLMLGQHEHAIHNYAQAIKLKPDQFQSWLGLAHAYWAQGDYQKVYETNMHLANSFSAGGPRQAALTYYRLGYAAWKLGRLDEALSSFERAAAHAAAQPQLWQALGDVYSSMGYSAKAVENYKKLLQLELTPELRSYLEQRIID